MAHTVYNLIADTIPAVTGGLFNFSVGVPVVTTSLLSTPALIMSTYIIAEGIGSMTLPDDGNDWPLYDSKTPDFKGVKTDLGVVYDTPGIKDGRLMAGEVIVHHGLQIRIRSGAHVDGWTKLEDIAVQLDNVKNATVTVGANDYLINNVSRTGPVIPLGAEPGTKERRIFVTNFLVTLKRIID